MTWTVDLLDEIVMDQIVMDISAVRFSSFLCFSGSLDVYDSTELYLGLCVAMVT